MIQLTDNDVPTKSAESEFSGQSISPEAFQKFISTSIAQGKQPLIIFGAEWCPDAKCLCTILNMPTVKDYLEEYFAKTVIDVQKYELNMELIESLLGESKEGVPRIFVLDFEGQVINLETNDLWRSARDAEPQAIFNYLQNLQKFNI